MNRALPFLALLALTTLNAGCTAVGVGAAVGSAGGVAAAKEGGIESSLTDARISATIHDLWIRYNTDIFVKLSMTVDQGRVLITGVVQKPEDRVDAVRLAWQAQGVKQVINEIKVADSEGIKGWARDSWISARLRSAILFDKDVQGVNYSIDTVQSVVYLMGVAQNQAELDKVMGYARSVPYVKQVVSYVKLAGTSITSAPASPVTNTAAPVNNTAVEPMPMDNAVNSGGMTSPAPVSAMPLGSVTSPSPMGGTTTTTTTTTPRAPAVPGRPAPIVDDGNM